jgi:biotin carboxyl carrier protein
MILFITLPFLGFYLGMQYQQQTTVNTPVVSEIQKTPTPTPTLTAIPPPTSCNTDSDCQNGAKCIRVGPIMVGRVIKACVKQGQAIPL